jgi:MoaA/NifB/PqqE/SkfB family radical SAM enzyme
MKTSAITFLEPLKPPCNTVSLQNVFLHVTKACNLYCSYCYFSARHAMPDEMGTAELSRLWPEMATLRPEKVVFTGGEPLLRKDIAELLRGLRGADPEHNILRCLNSNGHLVTSELARELVGLADEVRVSLDALAPRNDSLRGKGNFAAAVRALETYYAVGFEPKVLITVTRQSLPDLEDLVCFLVGRKFTRLNINCFRPIGRGKLHGDWSVGAADVNAALNRAWARCYPDRDSRPEPPEQDDFQCNCGVGRFLNIMPNGDVFPCHVLTQPEFRCGNVREESLLSICRSRGLLGTLARLDFRTLAQADEGLSSLIRRGACMGEVYARTQTIPAWKEFIPACTGDVHCRGCASKDLV